MAECVAIVNKERKALRLLTFDSICTRTPVPSSSKVRDVPTTDCPLFAASTIFTVDFDYNRDVSFQRLLERVFDYPYPDTLRSRIQSIPWRLPQFKREFVKDAEGILKGLGLPLNVTHAHMEAIAESIKCKACLGRQNFSWTMWGRRPGFRSAHLKLTILIHDVLGRAPGDASKKGY